MMKLYAVKSNHGELWNWNIENWHDYTDRSNDDFTVTKDTADDCAADHGGHVVELVEKPVPVTGDGFNAFLVGQVIKYISRYQYNGKPVEDLQKADWYLKRLISEMEYEQ